METTPTIASVSRAWYHDSIGNFLNTSTDLILGQLAKNGNFSILPSQRDSWVSEIAFLRERLAGTAGAIFFEFTIPRMGKRIDVVLLIGPVVFVVEFKVGATAFDRSSTDQVWDYALDLKNFHEASCNALIAPVLVATESVLASSAEARADADGVFQPLRVNGMTFRPTIGRLLERTSGDPIDEAHWLASPYRPTPTIVEAARSLYAQHSVEAIARHDAGAKNLHDTSQRVEELIFQAHRTGRKSICFVTGVPGAGKTLVGLNVATRRREAISSAVYLSGNGPLVAVLREALIRDEVARQKILGNLKRRGAIAESVKAFIQNVHHFRDEAIVESGPPHEHVVLFDEAQRAWTLKQTANFMQRKKNLPGFSQSEPEFLISYMDRHADWGVIVCLVGGGQEINTGEAGIDSWLEAAHSKFPKWDMYISSHR